jgi:hypothetical protein
MISIRRASSGQLIGMVPLLSLAGRINQRKRGDEAGIRRSQVSRWIAGRS